MSNKRYLVDQAIIWAPGFYRYTCITREKARHWLEHERESFEDLVADPRVRHHVETELGRDLGLHPFQAAPAQGAQPLVLSPVDVALVVRPSPGERADAWEYGLLTALDPKKHGPGL